MSKGLSGSVIVKFETEIGISTISASSSKEFLDEIHDIDVLRNLRVSISSSDRHASLQINHDWTNLVVEGEGSDSDWVTGRANTIASLLKRTRSPFIAPVRALLALILMLTVTESLLLALDPPISRSAMSMAFTLSILAAVFIYLVQSPMRKSQVLLATRDSAWLAVLDRILALVTALGTVLIVFFTILLWQLTRK